MQCSLLMLCGALLLLLAASPGEPSPAESLPALLKALAVSDAAAAQVREDVTVTSVREELASDGRVKERLEKVSRLKHEGARGVPRETLIRATEDGEDVTERERKKLAKATEDEKDETKKRRNDSLSSLNPFSSANQPKYRFTLVTPSPNFPQQPRIRFQPVEPAEKLFIGEAIVDAEKGQLLTVTAVPSKLPLFVHRAEFKVVFEPGDPTPRLSHFRAEGEGGFLFIKKRFRVNAQFSDYSPVATGASSRE